MESQKTKRRMNDYRSAQKQETAVSGQSVDRSMVVDIIFGIDATASMQNLLDQVKARALSLHGDIERTLKAKGRKIGKIRAKVLLFRDIYVDADAFEESEFFVLPDEAAAFRSFVENIRACGGGDEPESSLEALCRMLRENFRKRQNASGTRHIIIMLTDASAHRLDDPQRAGDPAYPQGMPNDLAGVQVLWEQMDARARRMVVFAPNAWPWNEVGVWPGVDYTPSQAGEGIDEITFNAVIESIGNSIG